MSLIQSPCSAQPTSQQWRKEDYVFHLKLIEKRQVLKPTNRNKGKSVLSVCPIANTSHFPLPKFRKRWCRLPTILSPFHMHLAPVFFLFYLKLYFPTSAILCPLECIFSTLFSSHNSLESAMIVQCWHAPCRRTFHTDIALYIILCTFYPGLLCSLLISSCWFHLVFR